MWQSVFGVASLISMVSFAILVALPRRPLALAVVLYLGVALLCLVYSVGLISIVGGFADAGGARAGSVDFTTIEGVRAIFATDGGATIGWVHYLALDLFAGLWIARDGDAKGVSRLVQAPILLVTFLAGPLGLLVWLILREKRARLAGWSRSNKARRNHPAGPA